MTALELLAQISDYCRQAGLAESTFGRRAVNDGKLANRLRNGGRITTETVDRIQAFMTANRTAGPSARPSLIYHGGPAPPPVPGAGAIPLPRPPLAASDPQRHFRFFDNRQKYLLFVNTCSEKRVVAHRVGQELTNIHPRPPSVRLFDAGVGDGTVLARVMRSMHDRFPAMPFYVVGKEISLEDIRLTLQKMPDRFVEHPATALVLTNLAYADAPWLHVKSVSAASSLVWHEAALTGTTAHRFEEQITDLESFLAENWKAGVSTKTGNPVYERPVVLVMPGHEDHAAARAVFMDELAVGDRLAADPQRVLGLLLRPQLDAGPDDFVFRLERGHQRPIEREGEQRRGDQGRQRDQETDEIEIADAAKAALDRGGRHVRVKLRRCAHRSPLARSNWNCSTENTTMMRNSTTPSKKAW